jgi:hypothetical protein
VAGQGASIRKVAEILKQKGWAVLFVCVPNTPHVGVIPIPTTGPARQRYTDIAALKGSALRLIEVEISLTEKVAEDISFRLSEQRAALSRRATWLEWSSRLTASTGQLMPHRPIIECELCVIRPITKIAPRILKFLDDSRIVLRQVDDLMFNNSI